MVSHKQLSSSLTLVALAGVLASGCTEETPIDEPIEIKVVLQPSSRTFDADSEFIARDTILLTVTVTEGNNTPRNVSAEFETAKNDPSIVEILTNPDRAVLGETLAVDTIRASVTQAIGGTPVFTELAVPVDSFVFTIEASSSTLNAGGDTLVGDTLVYSVSAKKARSGQGVAVTGAVFTSSDEDVIVFFSEDSAELVGPGTATVSVTFESPVVPGLDNQTMAVDSLQTTVTNFSSFLEIVSHKGSFIQNGDTLVTDSVTVVAKVVQGNDTSVVVDPTLSSNNPNIIAVLDATAGTAEFVDTGTATLTVTFTDPAVPRQEVIESIRVTTYRVDISGSAMPTMGDTVMYTFSVTDTRDGSLVPSPTLDAWLSSDTRVAEVTEQATGMVFARDTGQTVLSVDLSSPLLPDSMPRGSQVLDIVNELYYGNVSSTSGAYGDTIRFQSSVVHRFTDSTRVEFGNGAVAYVDSAGPGQIRAIVGAGNDSTGPAPLTLRNLIDEDGDPRDPVPTNFDFTGGGGISDQFEPNDAMPLNSGLEIMRANLPFIALLSSDHRSAPDSDYFYIDATAGAFTIDITAEWQQDANLDFYICNGDMNPPTVRVAGCARAPAANTTDRSSESETGVLLGSGIHIIAFYCVDCPNVPLTYRVEINEP